MDWVFCDKTPLTMHVPNFDGNQNVVQGNFEVAAHNLADFTQIR